jgi:small subunit ribosomal protein S21|tara:strand:- start:466 stop:672 length:207 start_codon:yes stop_codon:yes gene_type:complete
VTIEVRVKNGNVIKAMRVLKKKLEKDGLMLELRRRMYYEKPSLKKARERKQNIARCKKEARLREERDG